MEKNLIIIFLKEGLILLIHFMVQKDFLAQEFYLLMELLIHGMH
jgi:hypothetical protein